MDKMTRDDIRKKIRSLEEDPIDFQKAESLMLDILQHLLKNDGFIVDKLPGYRDEPFDYIARKKDMEASRNKIDIAIEYKHSKNRIGMKTIEKILQTGTDQGYDRIMVVTNNYFAKSVRDGFHYSEPLRVELIDIEKLKEWWSRLKIDTNIDLKEINIILKTMSYEFAKLISDNPENLRMLEWRQIEQMLAEVFEGIGFWVKLTPPSKDGGKDIILECHLNNKKQYYIIEVKHWRSGTKVGKQQIGEFLEIILKEERKGGLFISTYGFCNNAFECLTEIGRQKLKFGSQEKIITLCRRYIKAENGLWSPKSNLEDILFENTI